MKPKISMTLEPKSQYILQVLSEADGRLDFITLERVIDVLAGEENPEIGKYIKSLVGRTTISGQIEMMIEGREKPIIIEEEIKLLKKSGLIKTQFNESWLKDHPSIENYKNYNLRALDIFLTDEGARIAESISNQRRVIVRPKHKLLASIFVASAFGYDDIDKLYKNEFVPACNKLGYESVRVDLIEPEQTITESIMQSVTEAACVFVDLTHARPSVYFEAGFAHGLGIPLIITCRNDHFKGKEDNARVHFDLEQFRISFWTLLKDDKFDWQKGMSPLERLSVIVPKKSND